MDNTLQTVLELSRDPMLALADGRVLMLNDLAKECFPDLRAGDFAEELLPAIGFFDTTDCIYSTAVLRGAVYSVIARRSGGVILVSLRPEQPESSLRGCLSEGQVCGMLSTLFNISMAADRLHAGSDPEDAETQRYFGQLYHNYYSLSRRLGNLNALSTLSEGGMGLVLRHVDLVEFCAQLVDAVSSMTTAEHARLEFLTELTSLVACVDAQKLERLLLNLISNSLLHTPPSGLIRLRLGKSGANALLSVDDNGCGISPAKLKNVFCSFNDRMSAEKLSGEMNGGLGLALCSAIAEKHSGTIILESREGEGTSVRVLLPLNQPNGDVLGSESQPYEFGGMSLLLTELSELLESAAYEKGPPD